MGLAYTCYVGEIIAFPYALYRVTRHCLLGQDLRVYYDRTGRVLAYDVDGTSESRAP
jgi:hypothetical protein